MEQKHLYITVQEKEELKALMKKYRLKEQPEQFPKEPKPEQQIRTGKRGRRHTGQSAS